MPSGSKKKRKAAKKKRQKGGHGGLHINATSQNSSPGTDDLTYHVEMGSDGGLKSSYDGESDGGGARSESDGGDVSSPASQDHQRRQFGGGQENEEDEESKKGGTSHLPTFVDKNNSSEVIGDTLAMAVVDEVLMLENKPLNESNDGGMLVDDGGESSRNLENEANNLASNPTSPDDSAKREESVYAGSTKKSHAEEAPDFTSEPMSQEDSVKNEESIVKIEYVDSVKESCDGPMLGDDQSINLDNLGFELNEHGCALEPTSLDDSIKRLKSCNGNGEHVDSMNAGALVDGEGFKTGIADNQLEKQEACDFTSEFVSLDDHVKMKKSSNAYSGYFDSVKEIHGGTVGDGVAVSIDYMENKVKKEKRDLDSQHSQSVMELHDGSTVGVTRNSDNEAKNEEARDFTSEPALLYDSVKFGDSVMKEASLVIGSTPTGNAFNAIGDNTSIVDSSKLAHFLPENVTCSSETASTDAHVVLGAVTLGLKENKVLLSEEFPGVSTNMIGMLSKKNEENVFPLLDEVDRVSSSGISFASKENEDTPLCPSDHSGVPSVETANVSENIKDSEETLGCSERQPLVNSAPPPVKTSWKSCCGLFGVLTGSI